MKTSFSSSGEQTQTSTFIYISLCFAKFHYMLIPTMLKCSPVRCGPSLQVRPRCYRLAHSALYIILYWQPKPTRPPLHRRCVFYTRALTRLANIKDAATLSCVQTVVSSVNTPGFSISFYWDIPPAGSLLNFLVFFIVLFPLLVLSLGMLLFIYYFYDSIGII